MNILLNSSEVTSLESQKNFVKIINFLIAELVGDSFELLTHISDNDSFKISITGLPNEGKRIYKINFDIGLFKMIYDVTYVLLSNNTFFPNIGKSSGEFKIQTIEVPNWTFLDLAMANNDSIFFNEERKELHNFIYTLCLHFIVRHEIRHIANGHVDYLVNKIDDEFVEYSGNGLTPLDSQTLEMDVDSCVMVGFLNGFINIPQQLNFVPTKLRKIEDIFKSLLFVLKILFYCLPSKKISKLDDIENSFHPNSTLRYFFAFTAGLSFLQEKHPVLPEVFLNEYQKSWSFFETIGKQGLLSFERFAIDYEWSMSEVGQEYANLIWMNWNKWHSRLLPFTYLDLAPCEEIDEK